MNELSPLRAQISSVRQQEAALKKELNTKELDIIRASQVTRLISLGLPGRLNMTPEEYSASLPSFQGTKLSNYGEKTAQHNVLYPFIVEPRVSPTAFIDILDIHLSPEVLERITDHRAFQREVVNDYEIALGLATETTPIELLTSNKGFRISPKNSQPYVIWETLPHQFQSRDLDDLNNGETKGREIRSVGVSEENGGFNTKPMIGIEALNWIAQNTDSNNSYYALINKEDFADDYWYSLGISSENGENEFKFREKIFRPWDAL